MMQIGAMALAAGLAASGQAPGSQWWNPKDKTAYCPRERIDGLAPTGFLDQSGSVGLGVISQSRILARAIAMGRWAKPHAPDKGTAAQVLSWLDANRGKAGWDLACETLRLQVIAELNRDLQSLVVKESADPKFAKSPALSFGLIQLDWLNRRRHRAGPIWVITEDQPPYRNWRNWAPKDRRERAAHTLLYFSGMRFGCPETPVLEAAAEIDNSALYDCVFGRMTSIVRGVYSWKEDREKDSLLPQAVRAVRPAVLADEAIKYLRINPRAWIAAYAAYSMCLLLDRDKDAVLYGRRYLQTAPKTAIYVTEVADVVQRLEAGKGWP